MRVMTMHKIGAIGDYDSICAYCAVGFDIFPVEGPEQAGAQLKKLASEGYAIIYITEPLMREIPQICAAYDEALSPCIVPIPSSSGSTGYGASRLGRFVEQAVGSDIMT